MNNEMAIIKKEKVYIDKRIFDHYKMSVKEAKLKIMLDSNRGMMIDTMTKEQKIEATGTKTNYNDVVKCGKSLIEKGLIGSSTLGVDFKSTKLESVVFNDMEDVGEFKSLRQLYFICINRWNGKVIKNTNISTFLNKEQFFGMVGSSEKFIINKNIKRIEDSMGIKIEWELVLNTIKVKIRSKNGLPSQEDIDKRNEVHGGVINEDTISCLFG